MICKHCKTENSQHTMYCVNCGKPLEDTGIAQAGEQPKKSVYIAVAIALMVFLSGGMLFGFFYFSSKVQKANEERNSIASESDVAAAYFRSQIREQEDTIAAMQTEIDALKEDINEYKGQIKEYREELQTLKDKEEILDGLASFTDAITAQGYEDMFVSDTILHIKEDTTVRVCISGEIEVTANSSDTAIVDCTWDSAPTGPSVARLHVTPKQEGTATITITNNLNDEKIDIYVYSEAQETSEEP